MRFIAIVIMVGATFVLTGSQVNADSCNINQEGSGACAFSCPGDVNDVAIKVRVKSSLNFFRTVEGQLHCAQLAAACAGHGECQAVGGGTLGAGTCVASTGQGVDFTAACISNPQNGNIEEVNATLQVDGNIPTGTTCTTSASIRLCRTSAATCIGGIVDIACGMGVTQDDLRALYPLVY